MIEIIAVLAILIVLLLAKHRKGARRKIRRYLKGSVDENLPLGTLAARTLVVATFDEGVNERTLISSIVASYSLSDVTPGDNIGPVMVGVAHSDYTAAEIEAVIENTGSWNEGTLVENEIAKRKVRIIGTFPQSPSAGATVVLNNGLPIKTKLNWILTQGQTLDLWAYNLGSAAFATTDPDVHCQGHANLWPQ